MGVNGGAPSWAALPPTIQNLCNARSNFVPKSILSKLRTEVDAGAHAGSWTVALLERFHPERIIAVECEPRLVGPLKARFAGLPGVKVVEAELAENAGRAPVFISSGILQGRRCCCLEPKPRRNSWPTPGRSSVTRTCQRLAMTIWSRLKEEISILNLDIQGAECSVLTASQTGLQKPTELHPRMCSKGFGLYRLSAPYDRGGRKLYADAIYVREDILHDLTALR